MTARRLLALLGAIAIVVAAVIVRGLIEGDGTADGRDDGGGDGELVVVCATELAERCRSLTDVTVIEAGAADTEAALVDGDLDAEVDAWITTSAWTEVVSTRAPGTIGAVEVVATSPVVVAVDPARTEAVRQVCGAAALWRCLGDRAGRAWADLGGDARWGTLKTGLPDADSALGLPVLASVVAGFFGGTDFASNDFDAQGLPSWLGALADASGRGERDPVGTLVTRRGTYSAVGAVEVAVRNRAADVLEAAPPVTATIVVAAVAGGDDLGDLDALRDTLAEAGWQPASGEPAATFKPGVMAALHTLWTETT